MIFFIGLEAIAVTAEPGSAAAASVFRVLKKIKKGVNKMNIEERRALIEEFKKKFNLEESYTLDYGVAVTTLEYEGHHVCSLGGYEGDRGGHCCLSYYAWDKEWTDKEFLEVLNSIPGRVKQIKIDIEEAKIRAEKLLVIQEKFNEWKINVRQVAEKFKGFKYDGTRCLMIKDGLLTRSRRDQDFEKATKIEESDWGSEIFCMNVEEFLCGRYSMSQVAVERGELNREY